MTLTKPEMDALGLFPNGYLRADGRSRHGRLFAALVKKGLVQRLDRGKFSLTDDGLKAIIANSREFWEEPGKMKRAIGGQSVS